MEHHAEILAQNPKRVSNERLDEIAEAQFEHRPEPLWARFDHFINMDSQSFQQDMPGRIW